VIVKKVLISLAFSVGYSFLLASHIVCVINFLGYGFALFDTNTYPRFIPFCIIAAILAFVLSIALLFLNSKYWGHTLKSHDNELMTEIICSLVLFFPFWYIVEKILNWTHSAF